MHAQGLAAAVLASILFNVGVVLQAVDARVAPARCSSASAPPPPPRPAGLGRGAGARAARRVPQAFAYAHAPFVLVQPVLATGLLLVLVLGARLLHEHVGGRELAAVVTIIGGVALVAWGAPSHTEAHRGAIDVLAVFALLAIGGLLPFAVGARGSTPGRS